MPDRGSEMPVQVRLQAAAVSREGIGDLRSQTQPRLPFF
jgi:hypothetical protein